MPVTAYQKMLVEKTFREVAMNSEAVAASFYARLFEIAPSLKPLFKTEMKEQGRKFMQMIAVAVSSLGQLGTFSPALESLGARHVGYGVKKEDYQTVGSALLWTLEQTLGGEFTPDVKGAWAAVYTALAEMATAKAYPAEATRVTDPSAN